MRLQSILCIDMVEQCSSSRAALVFFTAACVHLKDDDNDYSFEQNIRRLDDDDDVMIGFDYGSSDACLFVRMAAKRGDTTEEAAVAAISFVLSGAKGHCRHSV